MPPGPRTVRIGDPAATLGARGGCLGVALLAVVVVVGGVLLVRAEASGVDVPRGAFGGLAVGLLGVGYGLALARRLWSRLHKVRIGPSGTWILHNPLGRRTAWLSPALPRRLRLTATAPVRWLPELAARQPTPARLEVVAEDGRSWAGSTGQGPALLERLGYAPSTLEFADTGDRIDLALHTWEGGQPLFVGDEDAA